MLPAQTSLYVYLITIYFIFTRCSAGTFFKMEMLDLRLFFACLIDITNYFSKNCNKSCKKMKEIPCSLWCHSTGYYQVW